MSSDPKTTDHWILSEEATRWVQLATTKGPTSPNTVAKLREQLTPQQTHEVLELVELRKRAEKKFQWASLMYFERIALEQATDQWIAAYKASRYAGCHSVADLCCGIGGDAIGIAGRVPQLAICDRKARLVTFAQRNIAIATSTSGSEVQGIVDDVTNMRIQDYDAWHIDPDRRSWGRRTTHTGLHEPSDDLIDRLLAVNENGAIKLAPACEVPSRWSASSELEWISRSGECRQLVAWCGSLGKQIGERRATLLKHQQTQCQAIRTICGSALQLTPTAQSVDRYVYEPDAAVLASKLVAELALQHGWWQFSATDGYLTGPRKIEEPAASCFEVQDVLPMNRKKLSRYLRDNRIGRLEIKHRAVELNPNQLISELKLKGDRQATMLVTRQGEKRIAIIANRP